jgi:flagellar basal body P-ring formation protein FlgA
MKRQSFALLLSLGAVYGPCMAAQVVAPDELIEQARAALLARSSDLPGQLEIVPAAALLSSQVDGEGELRLEAGTVDGAWPRRRVGVPVQVWLGERLVQSRMVWFTVSWWHDVPVYSHDAQAGVSSTSLETHIARTDLAGAMDVRQLSESRMPVAAGLRLRRAVRAGQPVLAGDFEPSPAVARQAQVTLAVRHGQVELKTPAVAQGDGEVGELVKVLPSGASQWVRARVMARGEVAIEN